MTTFLINTIGIIIICVFLAYVLKECILSVLPIAISGLTLILFALCLIRHLSWIDYFFMLAIVSFILTGCCFRKKIDWIKLKTIVLDPNNIIIVMILLFIYMVTRNRIGSDWDELGVWAIEVKTMFHTDGLSLPNMHTSIGYANYIPGQMVVEWWFCHLFPSQFHDNLMFFGYYSIYYFIIAPPFLNCVQKNKNKWQDFASCLVMIPILFVLPSSFCIHEYSMLSVELLISAVFCSLIYSIFDAQPHMKAYTRIRWVALSIMLVLLKMDGILFLAIAYLTASILIHMDQKESDSRQKENDDALLQVRKGLNYGILIFGLSLSAAIVLIWQTSVRYFHRYGDFSTHNILDNLKGILQNVNSGNVKFEEDRIQYIHSFKEALLRQPLHVKATNFFDLTVISCIILIMLVFYLIYKNQGFKNGKREYIAVNWISIGSIVAFLLMLLFMYIYIFREEQYFSSDRVIKSLSRYAEPLFLGWSLTGLLVCLNFKKPKLRLFIMVLFLMCPSYTYLYDYFDHLPLDTEETKATYAQGREQLNEFFRENEEYFGSDGQGRILLVLGGDGTDLNIREFRYLTAPRSVCILHYDDTDNFEEMIYNTADEDACGYIYFEQIPKDIVQSCVNEYNLNPLGNYLYEITK